MLDTVVACITRHCMLAPGDRAIAAVSGGPDSVCLLHVLREAAPSLGFTLAGVAHCNHRLRGSDSDEDVRFVASLAADFQVPFYLEEAPPGPGNLEQSARQLRRRFFHQLVREGKGTRVALGHTRDDQAETVLLRLLRGSGLTGLAGILPVTAEGIIRPLLDVRRLEVRAYLEAHRIVWREDSSNGDLRFARNRIRHDLLPRLERDWNPQVTEALSQLASLAYEEEKWWGSELGRLYPQADPCELRASELASMPAAPARRLIRNSIRAAIGHLRRIEFEHIESVLALARRTEGDGSVVVPGLPVERSFDWIRFGARPTANEPVTVPQPGVYPSPDANSLIEIDLTRDAGELLACDTLKSELSWPKWPVGLELRGWMAGDRYRPRGSAREYKLTELFQEARIPSWRRPVWPILTKEGRIVWTRLFGLAADAGGQGEISQIRVHESTRRSRASYLVAPRSAARLWGK